MRTARRVFSSCRTHPASAFSRSTRTGSPARRSGGGAAQGSRLTCAAGGRDQDQAPASTFAQEGGSGRRARRTTRSSRGRHAVRLGRCEARRLRLLRTDELGVRESRRPTATQCRGPVRGRPCRSPLAAARRRPPLLPRPRPCRPLPRPGTDGARAAERAPRRGRAARGPLRLAIRRRAASDLEADVGWPTRCLVHALPDTHAQPTSSLWHPTAYRQVMEPIEAAPDWYDGWFEREWLDEIALQAPAERTELQVAFLLERLEAAPGRRMLDLACGHGRISLPLARAGWRVTGLDLSERSLALAREASERRGWRSSGCAVTCASRLRGRSTPRSASSPRSATSRTRPRTSGCSTLSRRRWRRAACS